MLAAAAAAGAAIWLTTAWLLNTADHAREGTDRAKVRVDAVRTGLAAGAGAGAAVGLLLAFRRQRHAEIATTLSDYDAAERRVTELYNAAAEQLGSDKAPVRLTALYTLERLANNDPSHRQTIVNIICAYLRMPYTPPLDPTREADPEAAQRAAARRYHAVRGNARPAAQPTTTPNPNEERQVRLTAQRILLDHLKFDARVPWNKLDLDLTGATLLTFDLSNCTLSSARLSGATFHGTTDFRGLNLAGEARFDDTIFSGLTLFMEATFAGSANFGRAIFSRQTDFGGASFSMQTSFERATFSNVTNFGGVTFSKSFSFNGATFAGPALFSQMTSSERATFRGSTFSGYTEFNATMFKRDPAHELDETTSGWFDEFGELVFSRAADFSLATFSTEISLDGAIFSGDVSFRSATFSGNADFSKATFKQAVDFADAAVADLSSPPTLPAGWRIEPGEGATGLIVNT
ncbi:pentapeptide repeat-containing protein [Actinomadura montaniterrae]|uniref:Pentapeptide repeat-containing protein n=1 Tax=Actinomadura montaniterrae TaxID=1803903 RepID=A0A6L3W6G3_9ACTN|nr:pentapeptide repeat-containing protein [Actinomadura montaniterrae]KAB2390488.1 pentapeptide repeat-containing protein [Actinomadura montaniterrae]